jgi:hypothetical protein
MTLVESQPDARPVRRCSVEVAGRAPANASERDDSGTNDDEKSQLLVQPKGWRGWLIDVIKSTKKRVWTVMMELACVAV